MAPSKVGKTIFICKDDVLPEKNEVELSEDEAYVDEYFPRDGYDYEQHLRPVMETNGGIILDARKPDLSIDPVYEKPRELWTKEEAEIIAALHSDAEVDSMDEDDFDIDFGMSLARVDQEKMKWGNYKPLFTRGDLSDFIHSNGGSKTHGLSADDFDFENMSVTSSHTVSALNEDQRDILERKFAKIMTLYEGDEEDYCAEMTAEESKGLLSASHFDSLFDDCIQEMKNKVQNKKKKKLLLQKLSNEAIPEEEESDLDFDEYEEDGEDFDDEEEEELEKRYTKGNCPTEDVYVKNWNKKSVDLKKTLQNQIAEENGSETEYTEVDGDLGEESEEDNFDNDAFRQRIIDESSKERILNYYMNDVTLIEEEDPFADVGLKSTLPEMDCETILTTKTNIYNRPMKLSMPTKPKPQAVQLKGVHQMPVVEMADGMAKFAGIYKDEELVKKQALREERKLMTTTKDIFNIMEGDEEDSDDCGSEDDEVLGQDYKKKNMNIIRDKNETAEEKKERKRQIKEAQRLAREQKKSNKLELQEKKKTKGIVNPYDIRTGVRSFKV